MKQTRIEFDNPAYITMIRAETTLIDKSFNRKNEATILIDL